MKSLTTNFNHPNSKPILRFWLGLRGKTIGGLCDESKRIETSTLIPYNLCKSTPNLRHNPTTHLDDGLFLKEEVVMGRKKIIYIYFLVENFIICSISAPHKRETLESSDGYFCSIHGTTKRIQGIESNYELETNIWVIYNCWLDETIIHMIQWPKLSWNWNCPQWDRVP